MYYKDHRTQKGFRSTSAIYLAVLLSVAVVLVGCGEVGVGNPVISVDDALIFGGPDSSDNDDDDDVRTDPTSTAVTVTYNLNGGTGDLPVDSTAYSPGDTVTVQAPTNLYIDDVVDRDFVYWNTKSDGTGDFYVPDDTDYETSFTVGSEDVTLYAIYIGSRGPAGGWIFYDDQDTGAVEITGARFLEAAPYQPVAAVAWSNVTTTEIGTTSLVVGEGQNNTDEIIAQPGHTSSAALVCRNLGSEWFLPSLDELNAMYTNLKNNGIGSLSTYLYWSSSEYDSDQAIEQAFGSGDQTATGKSTVNFHNVRAARAF